MKKNKDIKMWGTEEEGSVLWQRGARLSEFFVEEVRCLHSSGGGGVWTDSPGRGAGMRHRCGCGSCR